MGSRKWKYEHTPGPHRNQKHSRLQNILRTELHIYTWIASDYTNKDIGKAIKRLKDKKSHGSDGIPGEAYKVLNKHIAMAIAKITNNVKWGTAPERMGRRSNSTYI